MRTVLVVALIIAAAVAVSAVDVQRRIRRRAPAAPAIGDTCRVPYTQNVGTCSKPSKCKGAEMVYTASEKIKCPSGAGCCYKKAKPQKPTPSTPTTPTTPTTGGSTSGGSTSGGSTTNGGSTSGGSTSAGGGFNINDPLSVRKSSNPSPLVADGSPYCRSAKESARTTNRLHWVVCLATTDVNSIPCVWSIEDEQCVSRSDNRQVAILQKALRYTPDFVRAHYAASPISYIDLNDPNSVVPYIRKSVIKSGSNCLLNINWRSCLLTRDMMQDKGLCVWSIEDDKCVSPKDAQNAEIAKRATAYPVSFVIAKFNGGQPFPLPKTFHDLKNPLSVKVATPAKKIPLAGDGSAYCRSAKESARTTNRNHWVVCQATTDVNSIPCLWSIEDEQCVSRADDKQIGIIANAVEYTPEYVVAHYKAAPVTYVDLNDPKSVVPYIRKSVVKSGSLCLLNTQWWACQMTADELAAGKNCIWSIEDEKCVSRADTQNQEIVNRALAYPPTFVEKVYGGAPAARF